MWLSRQTRSGVPEQALPEETTVQTVRTRLTDGRNTGLQLVLPGGFAWRPSVGERLLVLKNLVLGSRRDCPVALAPGECCLYTQAASIHLTVDGSIILHGSVIQEDNEEE